MTGPILPPTRLSISQGARLDFSATGTGPRFWQEVQERVMGTAIPDNWLFDTLIVDEGQDFEVVSCAMFDV